MGEVGDGGGDALRERHLAGRELGARREGGGGRVEQRDLQRQLERVARVREHLVEEPRNCGSANDAPAAGRASPSPRRVEVSQLREGLLELRGVELAVLVGVELVEGSAHLRLGGRRRRLRRTTGSTARRPPSGVARRLEALRVGPFDRHRGGALVLRGGLTATGGLVAYGRLPMRAPTTTRAGGGLGGGLAAAPAYAGGGGVERDRVSCTRAGARASGRRRARRRGGRRRRRLAAAGAAAAGAAAAAAQRRGCAGLAPAAFGAAAFGAAAASCRGRRCRTRRVPTSSSSPRCRTRGAA